MRRAIFKCEATGVFVMDADTVYSAIGGYGTVGSGLQQKLGIDPAGEEQISGMAPHWRVAVDRLVGEAHRGFGTVGCVGAQRPGRDPRAGRDKFTDVGLDTPYQTSSGKSDLAAMAAVIFEWQTWNASYALGNTSDPTDHSIGFKVTADYLYDKTHGFVLQTNYFACNKGEVPPFGRAATSNSCRSTYGTTASTAPARTTTRCALRSG